MEEIDGGGREGEREGGREEGRKTFLTSSIKVTFFSRQPFHLKYLLGEKEKYYTNSSYPAPPPPFHSPPLVLLPSYLPTATLIFISIMDT